MDRLKLLQFILSIFLIPLMLLSTTGVRVSQHWCGDLLVSATIWGEAEPCSHFTKDEDSKCPMHAQMAPKKNCCEQKAQIIDGGDEDFKNAHFSYLNVLLHMTHTGQYEVKGLLSFEGKLDHFRNHSPPLIGSKLFVLIQSFLL